MEYTRTTFKGLRRGRVETKPTLIDGVSAIAYLRKEICNTSDPGLMHGYALRNTHAGYDTFVGTDIEASLYCIQVCSDFIDQGIPCSHKDADAYASVFLIMRRWPDAVSDEMARLMVKYIENGYFRLNNNEDAFGAASYSISVAPGRSPLEVAIRQGHFLAAEILANAGDRFDYSTKKRGDDSTVYRDLHELAAAYFPDDKSFHQRLRSADIQARMLGQISASSIDVDGFAPVATPRARRMGI